MTRMQKYLRMQACFTRGLRAAVLWAFVLAMATGCDTGGGDDVAFDIDDVRVSVQQATVGGRPGFDVAVENRLDRAVSDVVVDLSYWRGSAHIGHTPVPFTTRLLPGECAEQTMPIMILNPNLIASHADYDCYRYEVRAADDDGRYETKVYDGSCT